MLTTQRSPPERPSAFRCHHLIKTFYAGFAWTERQHADGTITWTPRPGIATAPIPTAAPCFPRWPNPPPTLGDITAPDPSPHRAMMMPTRRQTREQGRRDRITNKRRERTDRNAQEQRERQAWLAANDQPPPF
ncbi:MAG TPA: hypothetical protein VGP27_20865 [Mycobacterium sp.]|nr:hypothetical protein [Mycobacterium sp.]